MSGEEVHENWPITFDEIINGVATSATNLKPMRNKRLNLIIFIINRKLMSIFTASKMVIVILIVGYCKTKLILILKCNETWI